MIVEPTPTTPRSPIGRALRALGLGTPILLLLAVAGFGLIGPRADPPIAAASSAPSPATVAASSVPVATPPATADGPAPAFPASAAGLRVRSVLEAQPELAAATGSELAIAGWLEAPQPDASCTTAAGYIPDPLGPLCHRRARLLGADPGAGPNGHVHVDVPPGVRLPLPFEVGDAGYDPPMAIVVVGHAEGPGSDCRASARGCSERFTADLVAWADGADFHPGVVFDAGLDVPGPAIAFRNEDVAEALAAGTGGTVLVAAILRPATVASVDPDAAAALATGPPRTDLVWYVRALVASGGASGRRWAVVDHATGAHLASGGAPALAGPFPAAVDGLPVRNAEDVIAAYRRGSLPPVVAIAGYLRAWTDPAECTHPIAGLTADGCGRAGILALHTFGISKASGSMDFGTHLHAYVPPGVVIPATAVGLAGTIEAPAPPVVVVARFGPPTDACLAAGPCEAFFALEAVAWISGDHAAVGRQVADGVPVARRDRVEADLAGTIGRVFGPDSVRLRAVLVRARDIASVDRAMATSLEGGAAADRAIAVWYLRVLRPDGTIEAAVVTRGGRVLVRATAG